MVILIFIFSKILLQKVSKNFSADTEIGEPLAGTEMKKYDEIQNKPGPDGKILKIFSPKHLAKKWRFLLKLHPASFCENVITTKYIFSRKTPIFYRRKLAKIAEHCDHNIEPRT
jgi:hypothetical protein